MFTLRVIKKDGALNTQIGEEYVFVDRFSAGERFRKVFKDVFTKEHWADLDKKADSDTKGVIGFICSHLTIPIYGDESAFIVSDNGKTFERLNRA